MMVGLSCVTNSYCKREENLSTIIDYFVNIFRRNIPTHFLSLGVRGEGGEILVLLCIF